MTLDPVSPYSLIVYDEEVSGGETVNTKVDADSSFMVLGQPNEPNNYNQTYIYRHVGNDYVYQEFEDVPQLVSGDYTVVIFESALILSKNPFEKLREFFIPTALAQAEFFPTRTYTISFTVVGETPPPPPSNILFIPGILGSRLYEESDVCADEAEEAELWVSLSDCAQRRLTTNFIGQSDNDIYTRPEAVIDDIYSFNIYQSFLGELADWKTNEIINDYATFPYDWRMSLDNIITAEMDYDTDQIRAGVGELSNSYLYQLVSDLVANSANGKVTIVSHSKGGLVAKHFLSALEQDGDPLLEQIDNLILVGVPQVGTPDAIIGALHGTDLGGGVVMTNETSRLLLNNFPSAYHLLPTSGYFSQVTTPVISFETGTATNPWRNTFGADIGSVSSLNNFLGEDSGREVPTIEDLDTPEVLHNGLLNYAEVMSIIQNTWTPPSTLKVFQVAGTGLKTPAKLVYYIGEECISRALFLCTQKGPKILFRTEDVYDGDGTVVTPSALAMAEEDGVERYWVDLKEYNRTNIDRVHKDLFEIQEVINFVKNTALSSSTSYSYLSTTTPVITKPERLNFTLHSPLEMSLTSLDGEVSSSTNTLEGATYRSYGETKFISILKSTRNPELKLKGYREGSFTLDLEEEVEGVVEKRYTYSAVPSATNTKVILSLNVTDPGLSTFALDYEGDSIVDVTYDTSGPIMEEEEEVTYEDLYAAINALNLKKTWHTITLALAKKAEYYHDKAQVEPKFSSAERFQLKLLKSHLLLLAKLKVITKTQVESVIGVIDQLLFNI